MIRAGRACQLLEKEKSPLWARAVMSALQAGMLNIPLTCLSPYKGVYVSTLNVKKSGQGVLYDTLPKLQYTTRKLIKDNRQTVRRHAPWASSHAIRSLDRAA